MSEIFVIKFIIITSQYPASDFYLTQNALKVIVTKGLPKSSDYV